MKKLIALALSLVMLMTCAAAFAESAGSDLMVPGAFTINYADLVEGYQVSIYMQNEMTVVANIFSSDKTLPRMGLMIVFNDEWSGTERLNDASEEDMEAVKESFYAEYSDLNFEIAETAGGHQLLVVKVPGGQDAYIYTIYQSHEIEMHIMPGEEQDQLTDEDVDRVVKFLSDLEFVPEETK